MNRFLIGFNHLKKESHRYKILKQDLIYIENWLRLYQAIFNNISPIDFNFRIRKTSATYNLMKRRYRE